MIEKERREKKESKKMRGGKVRWKGVSRRGMAKKKRWGEGEGGGDRREGARKGSKLGRKDKRRRGEEEKIGRGYNENKREKRKATTRTVAILPQAILAQDFLCGRVFYSTFFVLLL